jgi:alpha-1,2-mannosyltransferase
VQRKSTRITIVVVLAVAALAFDAAFAKHHGFFDLNVYYGAINYWVRGQGELYDYIRPASTYGYTYPPFAALMMTPMVLVPWLATIVIASVAAIACSVLVVKWLIGHRGWFAVGVILALLIAFEPARETFLFGQVNLLLVALVVGDLLLGAAQGRKWAGIGVGLATAVKLTPGLFILYLLITKRFRAAFVAMATAAAATLLAAAIAPDATREFFTAALWDTDRVGALYFVSNQSLQGVVARLHATAPSKLLWLVLVVGVLVIWVWRSRKAAAAGDEFAGLALTGVVSCLVSPVTWVHHLVWLVPALVVMVDRGRWWPPGRLWLAGGLYALLCSRVVWLYEKRYTGLEGFLGSNAYVWASLVLLFAVPVRSARDAVTDFGVAEGGAARKPDLPLPVRP